MVCGLGHRCGRMSLLSSKDVLPQNPPLSSPLSATRSFAQSMIETCTNDRIGQTAHFADLITGLTLCRGYPVAAP